MMGICFKDFASDMAPLYLLIVLITQISFIYSNEESTEQLPEGREILANPPMAADDETIKDFRTQTDWIDLLTASKDDVNASSSAAAMMAQITNSNRTLEEQLEDMKIAAQKITKAIENELIGLLTYASSGTEKETTDEKTDEIKQRKRRSVETPMDSTELVMRLLKHIKSNNDYQNIAIEKMMSAQEIAEKYNIPFNPDPEILTDLAVAANEHAKELSAMLVNEADDMTASKDKIKFVPIEEDSYNKARENETYYVYSVSYSDDDDYNKQQGLPPHEYKPQQISSTHHSHHNDHNYPSYDYYYNSPYETQIPPPTHRHHNAPITQKPSFYDLFGQTQDYSEPLVFPFEDMEEPESELVGEEFEETITSKVIVDRGDEPGSATVNHVMTYTVSEKSHFRSPQIEKLPQQVQYCFLLI